MGDSESKKITGYLPFSSTDVRRRTKFSHDPNNTAWANSTDGYGQRMLQSHGWTPGASLGARNKSYTKAKGISHIRVTLKDDNLGLGAKSGPNVPQPGLDAFQGLLGRLNGKSDVQLVKEQNTRDDLRRVNYSERRWGGLHFISGGLLVGDRIEEPEEVHDSDPVSNVGTHEKAATPAKNTTSTSTEPDYSSSSTVTATNATIELSKEKKSKKRKKYIDSDEKGVTKIITKGDSDNSLSLAPRPDQDASDGPNSEGSSDLANAQTKLQRRAEKAQRKLDRQARKAAKRALRAEEGTEAEAVPPDTKPQNDAAPAAAVIKVKQLTRSPGETGSNGRNAVRRRNILQKKMALADPRALNEV